MSEASFLRLLGATVQGNELFLKRATRTITAALALNNTGTPTVQLLSAAAAQNVQLPLETVNDGKILVIVSTGAGTLTLQSNAGGALNPPVTVATNAAVIMYCDGTVWRAISTA